MNFDHPALHVLGRVAGAVHKDYIDRVRGSLGLCEMFFLGLPCVDDSCAEDWALRSAALMLMFEEKAEEFEAAEEMANWEEMCCGLEDMMEQYCKPVVQQISILFLNASCESAELLQPRLFLIESGVQIRAFIAVIRTCIWNLEYTTHITALIEKQFAYIQEKLKLLETVVLHASFLPIDPFMRAEQFMTSTQAWLKKISHLVCFYWTAERLDDSLAKTTGIVLFGLNSVDTIKLQLDVILVFRSIQWMHLSPGFVVWDYVKFLLEPFASSSGTEMLHEGLVFLLSFVLDMDATKPHLNDVSKEREVIVEEIYDIMMIQLLPIICVPQMATNMSSLLQSINMVMIKVRGLYEFTPFAPRFQSPHATGMALLDSLLMKLQNTLHGKVDFVPSIKHRIQLVEEDLALLRSFVQVMLDQKKEHKELLDVWTQIVNVAYFAAYVADYCSTSTLLVWYGIICLPVLLEAVELVKSRVKVIEDDALAFVPKDGSSSLGGLFIGFKEEVEVMLQQLTHSTEDLRIISIIGMAGKGKTSLAKRVYNDPSIHHHFLKKVWCYVSKECNPQLLLVNIARDIGCNIDVNLEIKYLSEHINHSLRGKRYLIVLDDIWDVNLWRVLISSFPNDRNGSRIILTSRNMSMVFRDELSILYDLRFSTDEEIWELISATIFDFDGCPPDLVGIGKEIAVSCKGLPLAAALIASVLARTKRVYEMWEDVATNLTSHLAREGFTDIVGLSYENLPAYLKPCFLYFASFPRGQNFSVKKLKLLWIADGLVEEENWADLACNSPYADVFPILEALVCHSLVVSAGRQSIGGMKTCKVHELLYDMCLEKAVQNNFLHLVDGNTIVGECYSNPQKPEFLFHHRLCIHQAGSFTPPKYVCNRKQVSTQVHCILWSSFRSELRRPLSCFLERFKALTMLNLEDFYLPAFPEVILRNVHLRYLILHGLIEQIPPSIADLCNMEIIIVKRGSLSSVELPDSFWVIKSLRYVHIDRISLPQSDDEPYTLATCQIRVLRGIILEYGVKVKEFMRRLTKLKKLKCYCNGVLDIVWFECLRELESLHIRNLHGGSSLMLPNQSLPALEFPMSLKKLVMVECGLPWSVMSTIGNLPCLEVLKLRKWACVGTTWHLGDGMFNALRHLELSDLDLEQIDESGCEYPPSFSLLKLLLVRCLGLEDIPSCFSRQYLLLIIDVSGSSVDRDSLMKIMEKNNWGVAVGLDD